MQPLTALHNAHVVDVPGASRYELRLDGRLIAFASYRRRDGILDVTHTEVDPACEGRGFGSYLVAAVLDAARREGLKVAPLCPFVAHYLDRHPESADLVPSS